jgi:hypothetical protein
MPNTFTKWSATPLVGAVTVSTDGLTASSTTTGTNRAIGDNPLSDGSYYYEFTVGAFSTSGDFFIGLCQVPYAGDGGYGVGFVGPHFQGEIFCNGNTSGSGYSIPAFSDGDVVCVAVSLPNLAWFRLNNGLWNGVSTADPDTGVGGIDISGMTMPLAPVMWAENDSATSLTINAGQSAYFGSVPALFGNWPGLEVIVLDPIPTPSGGGSLSITGTLSQTGLTEMDYQVNTYGDWAAVGGLALDGLTFSGTGPDYQYPYVGSLVVRDHNTPAATSNAETFSSGVEVAGSLVYSNNFSTYPTDDTAIPAMTADGWDFFQNQAGPTALCIGPVAGLPGTSFYLNSQVSERVGASHTFTALSKGIIAFDVSTIRSTTSDFFGGYVLLQDAGGNEIIQFSPSDSDDPYDIAVSLHSAAVAVSNAVHHIEIAFALSSDPTEGFATLYVDGTEVNTYNGPVGDNGDSSYTVNTVAAYNSAFGIFGFTNLAIYDTSEFLTITDVTPTQGQPLKINGAAGGSIPTSLDVEIDGSGTWTVATGYSDDASWVAYGPVYTGGAHSVTVRDTSNPSIISNTFDYVLSQGWYTWNGVKLGA